MSPSRSHRSHPGIFARPLIPFREKPEPSSSSTEPTPLPSYLQRRYGLNEEIFERRVLSKTKKLGQKEEQREGHNDTNKGVVGVGSRLFVVESASGSAPDDTTRAFPVERRTTSATSTSTSAATASSGVELTPFEAIFTPTASIQMPNYDWSEPATAVITAASTTSPNDHDLIQSQPKASYVNNKSHVHRRSPSQRSQLVSDSEISVLDLGPSLSVSDAAVPVPVTAPGAGVGVGVGAGVIQMGAGSESDIELGEATTTIPISTTPSAATTKQGGYGYGCDVRGVSIASAPEESSGELAHYGDGGDGDGCGCGSSKNGSPDTGEIKKQQPWVFDGSDDRECEFDCQDEYDYGYGYNFDYGYVGNGDEHGAKHEDTTPAISSPVLAPLKTTRKEEAHGIGSRSRARAFCI